MDRQSYIYVVVSQTGTVLSRIIKFISKKDYNHASISFCEDLSLMYSFGRVNAYNPFFGGFVKESPHFGTFKRFKNTEIILLKIPVSEKKLAAIKNRIDLMFSNRQNYKYNYLGLYFAAVGIVFKRKNAYYCSEFVKYVLENHHIKGADHLSDIIHPMNFLEIDNAQTVYTGKLREYASYIKERQKVVS